ncbi:hypothetical protein ACIGBL_16240 [Streptomyces sp. NPDC085614]|uniref:hypothetical protein n=1 Tax=unclassified Streptomyces TaxID=2593676 RepID=UPI0021C60C11|nr:hypothetical protein [Streptomyces sp. ms191]
MRSTIPSRVEVTRTETGRGTTHLIQQLIDRSPDHRAVIGRARAEWDAQQS